MTRAFVFAIVLAACGKAQDTPVIAKHQKVTYPVDVAPLAQQPVTFAIDAPGSIDAYQVQVTSRVAGPVDEVKFMEGDEVNQGQPLVAIDRARYAIALSQAKAALAKAVASEKSAEAALQRRLDAQKESPGLVPGEEIEQKQTAVDTAKADVEGAKQDQAVAELNLKESTVLATTKGTVQTRTVQQGQYLSPGNVLATIIQVDPVLLRFNVSETDAPRLRHAMEKGTAVGTFTLPHESVQFTYKAKLSFLGEAADPTTRLFAATAEVESPTKDIAPTDKDALKEATKAQKRLRPGAFAQVSFPVGTTRAGIVVPQVAVQPTDQGSVVYIIDDKNVAHRRVVKTGMHTSDGGIELTSNVKPGELLVVNGTDPLSEGASVVIKNRTTVAAVLAQGTGSDATPSAPPPPPAPGSATAANGSGK
jgi:RND family efflux transporter MFP subunit